LSGSMFSASAWIVGIVFLSFDNDSIIQFSCSSHPAKSFLRVKAPFLHGFNLVETIPSKGNSAVFLILSVNFVVWKLDSFMASTEWRYWMNIYIQKAIVNIHRGES
jgi:uncharacterized membrane protein